MKYFFFDFKFLTWSESWNFLHVHRATESLEAECPFSFTKIFYYTVSNDVILVWLSHNCWCCSIISICAWCRYTKSPISKPLWSVPLNLIIYTTECSDISHFTYTDWLTKRLNPIITFSFLDQVFCLYSTASEIDVYLMKSSNICWASEDNFFLLNPFFRFPFSNSLKDDLKKN